MKSDLRGNFTPKNNFHITLHFLGEISEEKVEIISNLLEKVDVSKFIVKISKLTNLKNMVILEIEKNDILNNLQHDLGLLLKKEGFNIDDRNYYPHITLVREAKKEIEKELNIESEVDKITLFLSTRDEKSKKMVYTPLYERVI